MDETCVTPGYQTLERHVARIAHLRMQLTSHVVVISKLETDDVHVKLCDFGLAKYNVATFLGSMVGTEGYVAPVGGDITPWLMQAHELTVNAAGDHTGSPRLDTQSRHIFSWK
jgi:hypothetical protein